MLTDEQWKSIGFEPFVTQTRISPRIRSMAGASLLLIGILGFVAVVSGAVTREFSDTREVVQLNLGEYP